MLQADLQNLAADCPKSSGSGTGGTCPRCRRAITPGRNPPAISRLDRIRGSALAFSSCIEMLLSLSARHSRLRFRPEFGYRKDSNTTPSLVQLQVTVASAACVLCLQHFLRPEQHIESLTAFANPDSSEKKSTEFRMTAAPTKQLKHRTSRTHGFTGLLCSVQALPRCRRGRRR